MSTTSSVRIDHDTKKRLEALAKRSRRSKSFLSADAIAAFVEAESWQLDEIQTGIEELDEGRAVPPSSAGQLVRTTAVILRYRTLRLFVLAHRLQLHPMRVPLKWRDAQDVHHFRANVCACHLSSYDRLLRSTGLLERFDDGLDQFLSDIRFDFLS